MTVKTSVSAHKPKGHAVNHTSCRRLNFSDKLGSKLPRMLRLCAGNTRTGYLRTGLQTAAVANKALCGAMKSQHFNNKTLEVGEFLIIVNHNVMP